MTSCKHSIEQMLSRLESAKLAEEVQTDSESVTFDVIDPPRYRFFPLGLIVNF